MKNHVAELIFVFVKSMFRTALLHLRGPRCTGSMQMECPVLTLAFSSPSSQEGRVGLSGRWAEGNAANVPAAADIKPKG